MKLKIVFAAALATLTIASCGQKGTGASSELLPSKAQRDSVSYLLGINFGSFLSNYAFGDDLNYGEMVKGMKDFVGAKGSPQDPDFANQFKISPELMNQVFNDYLAKMSAYVGEKNRAEGEAFLAKNKAQDGVSVTASGLQYIIENPGSDVKPAAQDEVEVKYVGTLLDGTVFDQTEGDATVTFPLNGVIAGWTEGLQLIGEGGKIKLFIPAELAYGESGSGPIPPQSVLTFDVELLKVTKAEAAE